MVKKKEPESTVAGATEAIVPEKVSERMGGIVGAEDAPTAVVEATPVSKSRVKDFWATKYPDKSFENDDEFDGALADYLEDTDKRMAKHAVAEETFRKVASEHPELLDVVEDLAEDPDMPLMEAIYRNVDTDEFLPEEGEPDFERMRVARKERMDRESESEIFRRKLEENLQQSQEIIEKYFAENKVPAEEQAAIATYIDNIMEQYTNRLVTRDVLDAFRQAYNYEKDTKEAREVGKIEAKNARIDAERQRKASETDGMPSQGSSAGIMSAIPAQKDFLDEVLEKTEKRRNW